MEVNMNQIRTLNVFKFLILYIYLKKITKRINLNLPPDLQHRNPRNPNILLKASYMLAHLCKAYLERSFIDLQ